MEGMFSRLIDGHRVSKIIYGTIIVLVVIIAMEDHPPSPAGTVATVLFTGLGVALAEVYSEFIGTRISQRRSPTWSERQQIAKNVSAVMVGALLPLPILILAWVGVIRFESASACWSIFYRTPAEVMAIVTESRATLATNKGRPQGLAACCDSTNRLV